MKIDKPSGKIKRQSQTTAPVTDDGTLVDDTVALVDGTALVGGLTTTNQDMVLKVKTIIPRANIRIHR